MRVVGFVMLLAALAVPATAPAAPAEECPPVFPVDELTRGMTGTALSVVEGQTPVEFPVEILGVERDGIAPGRDIIIISFDSPVPEAGGWAGMSGSPVTVDGKLVGAIAYGLSFGGNAELAGVTPAEDMVALLNSGATATQTGARLQAASSAGGVMEPMRVPLAITGLNSRRIAGLRRAATQLDLPYVPVAGASSGGAAAAEPIVAGSNIAATVAYGDIRAGGVGTVTAVCGDRILAFGHPFAFEGPTILSAHSADALTIVPDTVFGSYKLATIGDPVGSFTVDRLAGIAGPLGQQAPTVPVTSDLSHANGTGRSGRTNAVGSERVPFATFAHLLSNLDVVLDRIGPGSALLAWTITGTYKGRPWTLQRENRYSSPFDIAFESVFEVVGQADEIGSSNFGPVKFESVSLSGTLSDAQRDYDVVGLRVFRQGEFKPVRRIIMRAGRGLRFQALVRDPAGDIRRVTRRVVMPRSAVGGGLLSVGGSGGGFDFGFECAFGECVETSSSDSGFAGLLKNLQSQPRNDDLVVKVLGRFEFEDGGFASHEDNPTFEKRFRLDRVVNGQALKPIIVLPPR